MWSLLHPQWRRHLLWGGHAWPVAYVTRRYIGLVGNKGCGFSVSRGPQPHALAVVWQLYLHVVWVRGKRAVLLSACQASHFEEDAVSDGRPASHAPVGLNEHYIKLNSTVPEGPAWPFDLQISAVGTEADLALRSLQTPKFGREFWMRMWYWCTLGLR